MGSFLFNSTIEYKIDCMYVVLKLSIIYLSKIAIILKVLQEYIKKLKQNSLKVRYIFYI